MDLGSIVASPGRTLPPAERGFACPPAARLGTALLAGLLTTAAPTQAATNWITIQEASFEIAASSTNYPGSGGATWNGGGSFTPTAGMFTDPIPDGTHVGWWNNSDVFYQNLTNTLSAGTYTLTLWQGKRTDLTGGYTPPDSDFNLAAGGTTLTPSGSSIPTVAVGQWRQASKTYTIATNAANLNQTLQIRCTSFGSGLRHADIDNVTLGLVPLSLPTSTITVYSVYGQTIPPVGTNSLVSSNTYVCAVTNSPVPVGTTTQYVCTGWTMTGNQPTNGSGTNFTLTITNNATLTWLWGATNYLLTVSTTGTGSGSVTPGTGWYGAGSNVVLTASSNGGSTFSGWSGDTNGCGFAGNVLTAGMSQARAIAAQFTMPPSAIAAMPSSLSFTGAWYGTPAVQVLMVSNAGSGTITYSLSNSAFWISESVTTGLLVGGSATTHIVRATARGLLPRTYAGAVTISAASATNGPVTVPVTLTVPLAPTPTIVTAWGDNSLGQTNVPAGLNNVTVIANGWGNDDCVALRADGTVAAWGGNAFGQTSVPASATNVVAVSSAYEYSLALRQNGTVVGWGTNSAGECNAPANLTNAVAISAGYWHSLAVRADGTVAAWGTNYTGECNVPASLSNAVSVASGYQISLALRADGTVMAWGGNGYFTGATNTALGGITNAVAVSCGTSHALMLKADGTVAAFGRNAEGQATVPATATNVVAIGTGQSHSLAVRADGAVIAWGYNGSNQTNVPAGLASVVMASGGSGHSWALSLAQNLTVTSPYGTPVPSGTSTVVRGAAQTCSVNTPVTLGTTQYVCVGWTGTGSAPASGTTNTVSSFTITNDTVVAWAWTTNYWLAVTTNGPGTIAPSNATGWYGNGSNVTLTATAATNGLFTGWAGDTNGCGIAGNVLTAPMTRARQIQAQFGGAVNLTVVSTYGGANPPAGTNALLNGSTCGCSVTNSPVFLGPGTQYVCTGWTMTGNQPTGGAGTNFSLTITNNAALTWTWTAVQTQAIAFAAIPDQLVTNGVGLSATASSGLAVLFAVGSGPGTLTGGTNLTFTGAGTVAVVASQPGNALWFAAPTVTNYINVLKVPQSITFPPPGAQYVTNTLTLAATAGSGLPVSFTVVSGPATLSGGSNVTFTATGAVSVAASQAGNGTWAAAASVTNTFNVLKVPQTITFTPPGTQFTTNTLLLTATASSGLPVSFAVISGPATLSGGSNITFTATGAVSVAASQTGSVTWAAATSVTNTFNVLAAAQTISFTPPGAQYVTNTLVLAATASSGLPVSFAVISGPATLSGGSNLTFTATGAVSVAASQTGSVIWAAAPSITNTFSVLKVPQTISFTAPGTQYATNTLKLAATASSGLPVSFAVVSGPATLSGGSNVTFTATGAVSVAASQTGSVTWAAAPSVTNTFNVLAAAQTISFTPPGAQYVTNTLVLAATASSGLPVSFAVVAGPATLSGGSNLTFTATGAVSVAASQTGSVIWAAAPSITNTFNVLRALQTVTFTPPGTQFTTNTLKLAATASSGLPVSFAVVSGPATLSGGSNLTFTAAGTVAVSASQTGSAIWAPATSVTNTFSVVQAAQTISFPNPGTQCVTNTLMLAATASSGLPVNFAVVSGPATLSAGSNITFSLNGTVAVVASQPGDAVWAVAPDVTNTFDVSRAPYTWTLIPSNGPFAGGNLVLVTNVTTRIGSGSDITNVIVGGVMATVTNQGTNWVVIGMPFTGSAGLKDVVVKSASVGATILSSAYTVNPPGQIGGVVEDWTRWSEVAGLPAPRMYMAAATLNGALYAIGGADYNWDPLTNVYRYDKTNWTEVAGLPAERGLLVAGVLNNAIYAIGGGNQNGSAQTNAYRYNGTNWTETASLPVPRMDVKGSVLNGALYAFGGYDDLGGTPTNMYRFNGTNWTETAALPASHFGMSAGVLNGALYALGGGDAGFHTNVYRYNGNNWAEVAGLPAARQEAAAGALNGALYVVGGYGDDGIASNVYRYNGTNWAEVAALPAPRYEMAAAVLDGRLYAFGGYGSGNVATNVYAYPTIVSTDFGVHPSSGAYQGGYPVVITGTNLGDGADITNVTLCGLAAASIVSQSATQVTIIAAASGVGCLGDVAVYSTSYGLTVKSNAFTYTVPGIAILGTNGAVVAKGETASVAKGSDFGHLLLGASMTSVLTITNTGAAALTISGWETNGANAAAFTVAGLPATLAAGAAQSFTVGCAPTQAGTFQAALVIANDAANYTVNLRAAAFVLSAAFGPLAGGNALTVTNGLLGSGSDITNVLVGGVRATIVAQGSNWVTLLAPATGATGLKDIAVQSTSVGTVFLPGAYTVNPAGQIGSVTEPAQWQKVASLPQGRCGLGAATLSNALYVMGGFGDDSNYNPKPNTYRFDGTNWTEVSPMPAAGGGYTAADTLNGVIYATGGNSYPITNLFRFNGTSWTQAPGWPAPRFEPSLAALNGSPYLAGGATVANYVMATNVYRLNGTSWTEVASLPHAGRDPASAVLNGAWYIIGGSDYGCNVAYTNVYRYDGTNWTEVAPLPAPRTYLGAGVLNGAIYVFGGRDCISGGETNTYRYDGTNWTEVAGLPVDAEVIAGGTLNGSLYAVGGYTGQTIPDVYRYYVAIDPGVAPGSGSCAGGYPVVITGTNLGNGSDVTNVTLCGVPVTAILGQSATQITVTAGAATPGRLGDVAVYSTSYGVATKGNAFTYIGPGIAVLGTTGAVVPSGAAASHAAGTDFGPVTTGQSLTNILSVSNSGNALLTISGWSTNSADAASFAIAGLPATLAAGATQCFTICYAPTRAGTQTASLLIANDATNYAVNLSGSAVLPPPVTVQIVSPYGTTVPPVGIWTGTPPWVLTNLVVSPAYAGATQFVSAGWVVAGNDPVSGSDTNFVMIVTNATVVTWRWATNVQFACAPGTNGTVTGNTNGWYAIGSGVTMTATPFTNYHFACWTGDVAIAQAQVNPLTLLLDQSRLIAAAFAVTVGTNYSTPYTWLAAFGYTQNMASAELQIGSNGLPLWQSYIADLNPTNPASRFDILAFTNNPTGSLGCGLSISFIGSANRFYSLLFTADLSDADAWSAVNGQANIRGNDGPTTLVDTNRASMRFYRLRVSDQPMP